MLLLVLNAVCMCTVNDAHASIVSSELNKNLRLVSENPVTRSSVVVRVAVMQRRRNCARIKDQVMTLCSPPALSLYKYTTGSNSDRSESCHSFIPYYSYRRREYNPAI